MNSSQQLESEAPVAAAEGSRLRTDPLNFGPGIRGWFRAGTSFLAVLTMLVVGIVYIFALYRPDMNDPDIWWHMRNAQYLFQHHQFPRFDTYSFTVAGHPWINHEWLAEIPFYLAYRAFGLSGIVSLKFLVLCTLFLLLLYLCVQESRNFKASIAACCYAVLLATVSFGPRTILFGYVYLLILLLLLHRFRRHGTAPLWIIPPLFCLWINTHGSWSIGLIAFLLIGLAGLVHGSWGHVDSVRWTKEQLHQLSLVAVASVGALFINPFGWKLVTYPFDLAFKQPLNIASIAEWASINFHDFRAKLVLVLIVGLLAAALFRNRRWNLGEVLFLMFAIYSGLTYIRFFALLGIVAAPSIARSLDFFPHYGSQGEMRMLNVAVLAVMIAAMIFYWPREHVLQESVAKTYPTSVLPFLEASAPKGRVLNFFLWGGFLEWNDPELKVFVDSRVDVFEYAGVLKDYLSLLQSDDMEHRPDAILDKYNVNYVLFPAYSSRNVLHSAGRLVPVLQRDPHWKTIYSDDVCVLLQGP
jgi:multisubunit Na+/H+ antiporter MnhB subunit